MEKGLGGRQAAVEEVALAVRRSRSSLLPPYNDIRPSAYTTSPHTHAHTHNSRHPNTMAPAGLPELKAGQPSMKAAVYYDKHDIRIEEVARPELKDGEVLVKVGRWVGGEKVSRSAERAARRRSM